MQVTVRVNGILAQKMGRARFSVELPADATARALLQRLQDEHPSLSATIGQAVIVIGGAHQSADAPLEPGREVALLMPVAGG